MVNAAHNRRMDKVLEFFELHSDELIEGPNSGRWQVWLSLPYVRKPQAHPSFAGYFSREWHDLLVLSWRNFLGDVFSAMPLPVMLRCARAAAAGAAPAGDTRAGAGPLTRAPPKTPAGSTPSGSGGRRSSGRTRS